MTYTPDHDPVTRLANAVLHLDEMMKLEGDPRRDTSCMQCLVERAHIVLFRGTPLRQQIRDLISLFELANGESPGEEIKDRAAAVANILSCFRIKSVGGETCGRCLFCILMEAAGFEQSGMRMEK